MAFRIEKRVASFLIAGTLAVAQPLSVEVRHRHLHGGKTGTLEVSADSVSFVENGKQTKDRFAWRYEDIQQVSLSASELRILTYRDRKWQLGRDRDYVFDRLPEGFAVEARAIFEQVLGRRFVAELVDPDKPALWEAGAKLRHGLGGSEGLLRFGEDWIAYQSKAEGESRIWRFQDIDTVSAAGPYDLTITTLERSGWRHDGPTQFRFQLKDELKEARYNELWRRVNRVKMGADADQSASR